MDHYCVMGNPVEHSRSPWIHARFAALTGQSVDYGKLLVPLQGLAGAVCAFKRDGGRGCNVTVPFKFEAVALATQLSQSVTLAGAANVLSFLGDAILADNTDGVGLVNDIQCNAGFDLRGRHVLLIGAGGAASGVLGPLLLARPASVSLVNRTRYKAELLVARHAALAELQGVDLVVRDFADLKGDFDAVINASASSLAGDSVPVSARVLKAGTLAYDMMYGASAQAFLSWAEEGGAQARDGLGMLVEQAAEAFLIWRAVRAPAQQVLGELRSLMA